jgi:hypothetical protein
VTSTLRGVGAGLCAPAGAAGLLSVTRSPVVVGRVAVRLP